MKKTLIVMILSFILINVCFSITSAEKLLLPEYKGDITAVSYRVIEVSDDVIIVEIDGVIYLLKR